MVDPTVLQTIIEKIDLPTLLLTKTVAETSFTEPVSQPAIKEYVSQYRKQLQSFILEYSNQNKKIDKMDYGLPRMK